MSMDELNTTPPAGGMPMVGRPIVNAHIDMTNRIEGDDIESIMMRTFADISKVLSDHCGPYGQFAMITSPNNKVAEPIFTKDGIGIIRAMEYMSPMQDFVRSTLAYMGSRVETAAGDGTTSSMIIFARGLLHLMEFLQKCKFQYSNTELTHAYDTFVQLVLKELDDKKYTVDKICEQFGSSREDIIRRIAYAQAYTSSHGNKELAKAVAEFFAQTPEEAWNYMYIDKSRMETDQLYTIASDDSQYTIENCQIWPTSALTEDLGTKRIRENETVIVSGIYPASSFMEGQVLLERVKKAIVEGEELTVLCPRGMDSTTVSELKMLMDEHPTHKVAFLFNNEDDPRINNIVCIKTLLDDNELTSEWKLNYVYEKGDLKITGGLYEQTDSKLNPMLNELNKYAQLRELMNHLDKVIKQIKSEVSNRSNNSDVVRLQKYRMKLMVSRRSYFLIGGSAYDNAAAVDVVVDAILAVKHTLSKGFCFGGNRSLYSVLKAINDRVEFPDDLPIKDSVIMKEFCEMFMSGIIDVFNSTIKWFDKNTKKSLEFDDSTSFDATHIQKCLPASSGRSTIDALSNDDLMSDSYEHPTLIIQPVTADKELIKRFGELAMKFVKTRRIVVPGGVCTTVQKA